MTRYEFKQPVWLLMIVLLLGFTANTLNAEDYTKRFLRGLYIGHAWDTENYLELSLNFLFGEYPGPEGDTLYSLHVTEFGDPNTDTILPRAGDGYFHLTRDYAPGEGKLFRFESRKA
jgi:hypothetical protein